MLPNAHTKAAAPPIPILHGRFHARYPEVAQPTPDVDPILSLPKRKAQKLKISVTEHTDDFTLFHIHLGFQFSFKMPLDALQKSLCRSRTLCQYHMTGTPLLAISLSYSFR